MTQILFLLPIANCSLEMMDKVEPPAVADGYGLSIAFVCMLDIVKSIKSLVQPVMESAATSTGGPDVPSLQPSADSVTPSDTGAIVFAWDNAAGFPLSRENLENWTSPGI